MPLDETTTRYALAAVVFGGVAGMAFGARYMRDMQKLSKDAERVYQASKPAKKPTVLAGIPSEATSQSLHHTANMNTAARPVPPVLKAGTPEVSTHVHAVTANSQVGDTSAEAHTTVAAAVGAASAAGGGGGPKYGAGLKKVRDEPPPSTSMQ